MSYRVFKPEALEAKADFTLKLTIPESSYDVKNPDGTSPVVSLKIEATSIRFALQAMSQMNEEESMLDVVAAQLVGDNFEELVKSDPDAAVNALSAISHEFISFKFEASNEDNEVVSMEITAPSGLIAYQSFQALSGQKKLNALAAEFMPLEHDYDDDADDEYDYS